VIEVGLVAPTLELLGGHSVQAARLIEAWAQDPQVRVRLLPINPPLPERLIRVARVKYARTAAREIGLCRLLLREARRVDLLHVFATSNSSFFLTAMPAIVAAAILGKPLVVNYRGDSGTHLARSAAARWLVRRAGMIAVPSPYFLAIFGELGIPSAVIPNVADLERFRYRPRPLLRPRVVSTRNFEPIYNVECTLRAFGLVQRRYPEASLVLVGAGSRDTALRHLARDLLLRNVTFAGPVPQHAMPRTYDAADIYVQTPLVDNMPGSLIEAFASGLPVVATAVGGVPLLLRDGVHGLLAPSDDDAAIARCIMALLDNPAEAQRMASAARATCGVYERRAVRERWRNVYSQLAGGIGYGGAADPAWQG
jgi:glycosyltransferase involved in cell wall biosynthesis